MTVAIEAILSSKAADSQIEHPQDENEVLGYFTVIDLYDRKSLEWQVIDPPEPVTHRISTLDHPRYGLTRPIMAVIETHEYEEGIEVTARYDELEVFGSGRSEKEAVGELKKDIFALYEDLLNMTDPLGKIPARQSATLKELISDSTEELRQGYESLAKMSFDDLPDEDVWLKLENEALRLAEEETDEDPEGGSAPRQP